MASIFDNQGLNYNFNSPLLGPGSGIVDKGTNLFSQIQQAQTRNLLDTIAQAETRKQQQAQTEANNLNRREGIGNLLFALSDAFAGRDIGTGFLERQEFLRLRAEAERQRQEELERQQQLREFITNANIPDSQKLLLGILPFDMQTKVLTNQIFSNDEGRKIIKGADGFNYFADTGKRVLPDVKGKPTTDSSTRFSILDNGKQIGTILRSDIEGIREAESKGFQIANLASPTTRPTGKNTIFDDLLTQHKATNKIISAIQGTANKFAEDPASALAVGGVAQFVDSVVQNIDQVGNFLKDTDNEAFQSARQGLSIEGTDFNTRIQEISQITGVTESRIKDLAYLFAAARGQTGRGLSDKDYENALRIVSGGVGARGRTAVLEDVANRLSEELMIDINYITKTNPDNKNLINQINNLPDINTFINPFTQVQPQSGQRTVDDILNDPNY